MYLFTRRTRLNAAAGLAWAGEITSKVTEVTGQPVELWGTVYSAGYGTITWTSWFEDLVALETFGDKLQADAAFQALSAAGGQHTEGGLDDGLLETVFGEPDPELVAQYVSGVQAGCAGGNIARGMLAGVEIAQRASTITGLSTLFMRSHTGPYAAVGWLTGYPDIASFQAAQDALAADPDWVTYLDSTEGAFIEDATLTQQTVYRRIV